MYFDSRQQAGSKLADMIAPKYRYEDCVVVALSAGGVIVGEQIAGRLHCLLTMLLIEDIEVPGEGLTYGSITQNGAFSYNGLFSIGEIEEYNSEYHGYLEQEKQNAFGRMNRLLGDGGIIDNAMLRNRVVILVSDGFKTGAILDATTEFLKPIRTKKIIIAAPIASVSAVDRMHILADELAVLDVRESYLETNHYYSHNDLPTREEVVAKISKIVLNWR